MNVLAWIYDHRDMLYREAHVPSAERDIVLLFRSLCRNPCDDHAYRLLATAIDEWEWRDQIVKLWRDTP